MFNGLGVYLVVGDVFIVIKVGRRLVQAKGAWNVGSPLSKFKPTPYACEIIHTRKIITNKKFVNLLTTKNLLLRG